MPGPEVLRTPAQAERHAEAWRALAASLPWSSYFTTPDWQLTWWEVLGRDRTGRLALWHGSEALDAVVGISHGRLTPRLPWPRCWTALGGGPGAADHLGWLVSPGSEDEVRRWLAATVRRRPLLLPNTDPDSGCEELVTAPRPRSTTPCPRVPLRGQVPPASSRQRSDLRRKARRVQEAGVTMTWHGPGQLTADILDELLALHALRAEQQGWATSFTPARRAFHLALMDRAGPGCGPAAVVARHGDRVVGVCYGFLWNRTFSYYQLGWDADYASVALGTVLLTTSMQLASDHDCDVFDLLRGAEPFKYRFGALDRVDTTWVAGQGMLAGLLRRHAEARCATLSPRR